MTVREIARAVLAGQGETGPAAKVLRDLEGGIRSCLSNHKGKTAERVGEGMPARWRLTDIGI